MALKVHVVKRTVPAGEDAGKEKYFGQVRLNECIPLEKFSERVSSNTTATPADVEAVLNSLVVVLAENLDNGNIIDLGALGRMHLTAGSSGADTEEAFHCRMMRRPRVVFTPGSILKNTVRDVKFERLPVKVKEVPEECNEPHAL